MNAWLSAHSTSIGWVFGVAVATALLQVLCRVGFDFFDSKVQSPTVGNPTIAMLRKVVAGFQKAFDADGITIPFPQRTVHLRPTPEAP